VYRLSGKVLEKFGEGRDEIGILSAMLQLWRQYCQPVIIDSSTSPCDKDSVIRLLS
jgi:hypothetical protein